MTNRKVLLLQQVTEKGYNFICDCIRVLLVDKVVPIKDDNFQVWHETLESISHDVILCAK